MAHPRRSGYPFTDPLGAAAAPPRPAKALARRSIMLGYGIGGITLGITLLTPDIDPSDHTAIAIIGALMALIGIYATLRRELTDAEHLVSPPIGTLLLSALVATAKPIALIPMFYIWPLVLAAYFMQRREAMLNFLLVAVSFGVALAVWVEPGMRLIEWVSVVVVGGVLVAIVTNLKESLDGALDGLRTLATRDPLTGALNRRAFQEALDAAAARAARGEGGCAVAILDIDHFKRINDAHGHAAGDRALRHLVEVIGERRRLGDVVGRLGGEEFAVLLGGTDARGAAVYAEDLRAALARDHGAGAGHPGFTISVGVAELRDGDGTAEGMLLAADRALYAAKDAGRDRVARAPGRPGPAAQAA